MPQGSYLIDTEIDSEDRIIYFKPDLISAPAPKAQNVLADELCETRDVVNRIFKNNRSKLSEFMTELNEAAERGLARDDVQIEEAKSILNRLKLNIIASSSTEFSNIRSVRSILVFALISTIIIIGIANIQGFGYILESVEEGDPLNPSRMAANTLISIFVCLFGMLFIDLFQFRRLKFERIEHFYFASYGTFFIDFTKGVILLIVFMLFLSSKIINISIGGTIDLASFYRKPFDAAILGLIVGLSQSSIASWIEKIRGRILDNNNSLSESANSSANS